MVFNKVISPLSFKYKFLLSFLLALPLVSLSVRAELLFEDDFSSGDFSNHNDFFRWGGDGQIPSVGETFGMLASINGPQNNIVNAVEFSYGTWQELRFHLTNQATQIVSEYDNPEEDAHYPEVWISYDLKIPSNYFHRSSSSMKNNKGFASLWQGHYSPEVKLQGIIEWWPTPSGNSELSLNIHGHKRNFDFVDLRYKSSHHNPEGSLAFLPEQFGEWVNVGLHWKAPTAHGAKDGIFEFYVDGQLKARMTGVDYQKRNPQTSGPIGFNKGYILGYHNSGYEEQTIFYVTNFRIGTAKQGVIDEIVSPPVAPAGFTINN